MIKPNLARSLADWIPACQWSFNQARCFHYIGGDSAPVFHRNSSELLRNHVSTIDDAKATWAACLDRIFSGETRFESTPPASQDNYTVIHLPIHDASGGVAYAAGFAYRAAWPVPSASELELIALGILQIVEADRTRTEWFLHNVIAQCLSSTGLQLEVQRLELKELGIELPDRSRQIQRALEETLDLIRRFQADQKAKTP
jgi:hypothetical protein